jgi:hypothetical protein
MWDFNIVVIGKSEKQEFVSSGTALVNLDTDPTPMGVQGDWVSDGIRLQNLGGLNLKF